MAGESGTTFRASPSLCETAVPPCLLQKSPTTPVGNVKTQVFQVTHPFHPLAGQRFELVDRYRIWGEDRVYYHTAAGELFTAVVLPHPAGLRALRPERIGGVPAGVPSGATN
ncbi:MAG: Y4bD/Y4pK family protein [Candidatus Contendobacter sp.]|nr:Y4bD/Y4pK family protein [Candidatus Contendobacter sp.]